MLTFIHDTIAFIAEDCIDADPGGMLATGQLYLGFGPGGFLFR